MKTLAIAGALVCALSLGACATNPATGDYTLFGQDVGAKNSALLAKYNTELQNFKAALPTACSQAKSGQGFTASALAVAQAVFTTLKPKTVSSINAIAADVVTVCNGVAVAVVPPVVAAAQ